MNTYILVGSLALNILLIMKVYKYKKMCLKLKTDLDILFKGFSKMTKLALRINAGFKSSNQETDFLVHSIMHVEELEAAQKRMQK